ncbi:site-specific DNA-methyltransferase [Ferrimonas balearica]|uniref:site-specific DNA-methyltransferase n=1 Tax=Ferrimonas balearica TaxID=44012 RepID=UPI001C998A61|nr:site-specific DNA-methyltransferase [Ferrimonas balearica]MBY5992893.1 site-specific DNA-methyltransferase [Ferrimonas balearica]
MSTFQLSDAGAVPWLQSLGRHSVDLVLTRLPPRRRQSDLAVATELKNARSARNQWFAIFPNDPHPGLFEQLYRVLKPDSHFYLFCSQEDLFVVKPLAQAAGFRFQTVLVWDQQRSRPGRHYRPQLGWICLFEKGHRPVSDPRVSNLLSYPAEDGTLPPALIALLLEQSSAPQQLVIDPFLQGSEIAEASLTAGRRFCGATGDPSRRETLRQDLGQLPGVTELLTRLPPAALPNWSQGSAQIALL